MRYDWEIFIVCSSNHGHEIFRLGSESKNSIWARRNLLTNGVNLQSLTPMLLYHPFRVQKSMNVSIYSSISPSGFYTRQVLFGNHASPFSFWMRHDWKILRDSRSTGTANPEWSENKESRGAPFTNRAIIAVGQERIVDSPISHIFHFEWGTIEKSS